jgi:hypothetical protein
MHFFHISIKLFIIPCPCYITGLATGNDDGGSDNNHKDDDNDEISHPD